MGLVQVCFRCLNPQHIGMENLSQNWFPWVSPVIASKGNSSLGRHLTSVFLCIFAPRCCSCCSSRTGDFAFFPSGKISHLLRNASGCVKISTLWLLACLGLDDILFRILTRPAK